MGKLQFGLEKFCISAISTKLSAKLSDYLPQVHKQAHKPVFLKRMGGYMSSVKGIDSSTGAGAHIEFGNLARFIPEPRSRISASFGSVLSGIGRLVGGAASGVARFSGAELPSELTDLINQQMSLQIQMQQVSMISNIEKSKHETRMAPIRNIRVG